MGLLDELKRRKVLRAAVVYGAAAFALLEFADIAFPRLGLPDGAVTSVLWLGIFGFPVALAVAWNVDVLPDASSAGGGLAGGWLSVRTVAAALLLVALGVGAGRWWGSAGSEAASPAVGHGPSIAVLPFENLNDDPAYDYFSLGLSDEIATALSRFSGLRVIPPSSTIGLDSAELGPGIGVGYVLRGSVRRSSDRVRVSARLLDGATGTQLWAESYDRDRTAADLFSAQDEIAQRVVARLADPSGGALSRAGRERARRAPERFEAYDCVLRAYGYFEVHTEENHRAALTCLEEAVKIAPDYADAWAQLAYLYREEFHHRRPWHEDPLDRAEAAGQRAMAIDPRNPWAHFALSMIHFSRGELEAGAAAGERSIELNPNDSTLLATFALYLAYTGRWERGLELARKATAMNPLHPSWLHMVFVSDHYRHGRYEAALASVVKINLSGDTQKLMMLSAIHGQLGRQREAERALDELIHSDPFFAEAPVAEVRRYFLGDEVAEMFLEGLRKAGLEVDPEGRAIAPAG